MTINPIIRSLMAAGLSAAVLAGCAKAEIPFVHASQAPSGELAPAASVRVPAATATVALPDFSSLVEKYGPAVVNISVTGTVKVDGASAQLPQNDPLSEFFRRFHVPLPSRNVLVRGLGSGFIISPDGVILTNAHVVDGMKAVVVKLTDKREYNARVVGKDKRSDVAVLKINASNLPTVRLGDSSNVKVGEWVVAIGSPYGFDNTVTSGIVSAKARALPEESYVPFLQTDVAVNPGNSGGPLFDLNGEVIGINSQIYSRTGGFQGLSFAIPIDVAIKAKNELVQNGHVTYGRIGVTAQTVGQSLADSFGLKRPGGALVSSVDPTGPAAKAGLKTGDVILKLDGKDVDRSNTLQSMVADLKPGTRANLHIWRNDSARDVAVTVGELDDGAVASAASTDSEHGRLGVVARALTPDERQQSGISGGLVVRDVSGPAAEAGIEPGDVILALNGTPVRNVAQLRELVAKADKHVALLVQRGDATEFVPVDIG